MPGIKADFVNPLKPRHVCGLCQLVVRSPMQIDCGHIFCGDCLKEAMSSEQQILCPIDDEKISQIFPDNACRREVQKLEVRCRYAKNNGCPWTGTLGNEEVHYFTCDYRDEQCPNCGVYMMWTKLKKHAELECPMRLLACRYCSESVPVSHEKLHILEECRLVELLCPNNCNPNRVMKRDELNKHLSAEDGDCPFSIVDCPHKPIGCSFTGMRSLLTKHVQEKEIHHQRLLVKSVTSNVHHNSKVVAAVQVLEHQLSCMKISISKLEKGHDINVQRLNRLEEYTARSEKQPFASQPDPMIKGTAVLSEVSSVDGQLLQRIPELFTVQEETSRAVEKLMSSSVDQELRIQLLEQATYNGVLVWKIDDVQRRMEEAVKGITVSLFSAPFYTDPRGYKMCARCYLNGYEMGKGTHFSLYFVVMRGLYDALLRWPFGQHVTMTLLNQYRGQHCSSTFSSDQLVAHKSSFQQPVEREMNVPIGFPKFIHHMDFFQGGFIKEGCIFVRVEVMSLQCSRVDEVPCSDLYRSC